jgi:hypothetical protein
MIQSQKPGKTGGMTDVRNPHMMTKANIKINKKFPRHTIFFKYYNLYVAYYLSICI